MDKRKIIEEGLLELYFFDELTASEKKEIEILLGQDNELRQHYRELEESLEKLAQDNAVEPPEHIKSRLLKSIKEDDKKVGIPKSIPLHANRSKFYLRIAAAIIPLLLLSTLWFYNQSSRLSDEIKVVDAELKDLENKFNELSDAFETQNKWYTFLKDPDVQQYIFKGNEKLPEARLVSYVNHDTQTVVVNTADLPEAGEYQDYQLWADVDGEMIDMGIIKTDEEFLAMNYIANAESYNITIEPEGGSEHPTVSNLIANVYLD